MNPFAEFVVLGKASDETKAAGSLLTFDSVQQKCSRFTNNNDPVACGG